MIKRTHHNGLVVEDIEKAVEFYRDVLGLELQSRFERTGKPIGQVVGYEDARLRVAFLGAGNEHMLELIQYVNPPAQERRTEERAVLGASHLCFLVDDIESTFRHVTSNGGRAMNPPVEVATGRKACYLQDPYDNWIELLELSA